MIMETFFFASSVQGCLQYKGLIILPEYSNSKFQFESFCLFIRYLLCMEATIPRETLMASDPKTSQVRVVENERPLPADELYREHHEHIFRFIWSRVHDAQVAEDLTGEVFMRMVANLSAYRDRSLPFRAWLYRIARNLIIDHQRKESSAHVMQDVGAQQLDHSSPEDRVDATLTQERLRRTLQQIDTEQREVVELRFLAELSLEEVSLVLNKSVPAVKALQHRGLAALRAHLKE
jgi:RNA polymerase sigma-70 factor (ECF subfamily)